jgi:hypothetical protein
MNITDLQSAESKALKDRARKLLIEGEAHAFECPESDSLRPASPDWAHTAARGIFYELIDRPGISTELDELSESQRQGMVKIVAEIIRQAYQGAKR